MDGQTFRVDILVGELVKKMTRLKKWTENKEQKITNSVSTIIVWAWHRYSLAFAFYLAEKKITPEHLIFNTSTEEQTVDLTNKDMTKDSQRFSPWFHSVYRTTGPILWHESAGGYMNVQTCGDTCEGPCAAEQWTKNTMQPPLPGSFVSS